MRWAVAGWRIVRGILHVLHGSAVIATRFPSLDAAGRNERVMWWSRAFLRLLDISITSHGAPHAGRKLLVANHVSWLDILAINAVLPAHFVSKSEVKRWPLVGRLVSGAGTLYIERARPRDAMRVVHKMAEALAAGDTVAIFPEGTTSEGHTLLPFHANLLQAAVATASPVQPVLLRYSDPARKVSPAVTFVGETTMLRSIGMVATARGLSVHVELLDAEPPAPLDRRELAARLHGRMSERLAELVA